MNFLRRFVLSLSKPRGRLNSDGENDESETLVSPHRTIGAQKGPRYRRLLVSLIFMTSFVFVYILGLVFGLRNVKEHTNPESGWRTEFEPSFPSLKIERVQFTAGLELDIDGDLIRTGDVHGVPQFVGEPNDEIDANWDSLIPSDTNITRDEARQIGGEMYFYPGTDTATVEISTFHVLHCLNQIRQSVYWKHYWPDGVSKLQQVHVDHCIDVLRQYIQCHVDLTPINLVWSKNKGGMLPEFRQVHTCLSFQEAHEWVLRRNIANYEHDMGDEGVADDARRTLERFGWA